MLELYLDLASLLVLVLLVSVLVRLVRGPTAGDRLVAGELTAPLLTFLLALVGLRHGSEFYMDAALLVALLGFISTLAIARFVIRKEVAR